MDFFDQGIMKYESLQNINQLLNWQMGRATLNRPVQNPLDDETKDYLQRMFGKDGLPKGKEPLPAKPDRSVPQQRVRPDGIINEPEKVLKKTMGKTLAKTALQDKIELVRVSGDEDGDDDEESDEDEDSSSEDGASADEDEESEDDDASADDVEWPDVSPNILSLMPQRGPRAGEGKERESKEHTDDEGSTDDEKDPDLRRRLKRLRETRKKAEAGEMMEFFADFNQQSDDAGEISKIPIPRSISVDVLDETVKGRLISGSKSFDDGMVRAIIELDKQSKKKNGQARPVLAKAPGEKKYYLFRSGKQYWDFRNKHDSGLDNSLNFLAYAPWHLYRWYRNEQGSPPKTGYFVFE